MPEPDLVTPELIRAAATAPLVGAHLVASAARLSGDTTTEFEGAPEYLA